VVIKNVTYKKIVFSLFTKKPKITLLMNTKNENMLFFRGKIKQGMSDEEGDGGKKEIPRI